jgi:hypothetical protein
MHPLNQISHVLGHMCWSCGHQLLAGSIAPSRRHRNDRMRAGGGHILGAIPDHHGLRRIAPRRLKRGADQVGLVARTGAELRTVYGVEEPRDAEMVDHATGRDRRLDRHDLKGVPAQLKLVEGIGHTGKQRVLEDAYLVEPRSVRRDCPIDHHIVSRAQQGPENRAQWRADHALETGVCARFVSKLDERVIDASDDSGRRVRERPVQIEEQVHRPRALHSSGSMTATALLRGLGWGLRGTGRHAYGS